MRRIVIVATLAISLFVLPSTMLAAPGPPAGLTVTEQNVDASGFIRVHEQGTASVLVTNSSLAVAGTVSIDNLPLDSAGALRVAAPGRAILMAENFDVPSSGIFVVPAPFANTAACHSLVALLAVDGERASTLTPQLEISPNGSTPFIGAAGDLQPPGTAATNAPFYFLVEGTSLPITAPFAKLDRIFNHVGRTVHVNEAWLICTP